VGFGPEVQLTQRLGILPFPEAATHGKCGRSETKKKNLKKNEVDIDGFLLYVSPRFWAKPDSGNAGHRGL
jgi:hypothetical protein